LATIAAMMPRMGTSSPKAKYLPKLN
jgi:hypothetical protein